jgi:hypothetical protein
MKSKLAKWLILALSFCSLSLITSLWNNSVPRRFVNIEQITLGGVVNINGAKYKTPYLRQQAQIGFAVNNVPNYLFLAGGRQQESFIGAVVLGVLLNVYHQAIKNKAELDLTI